MSIFIKLLRTFHFGAGDFARGSRRRLRWAFFAIKTAGYPSGSFRLSFRPLLGRFGGTPTLVRHGDQRPNLRIMCRWKALGGFL